MNFAATLWEMISNESSLQSKNKLEENNNIENLSLLVLCPRVRDRADINARHNILS